MGAPTEINITVDVTGLTPGTYTFDIIATALGYDSAVLPVTVMVAPQYTLTTSILAGNGAVTPDVPTTVLENTIIDVQITPDLGWQISEILLDDDGDTVFETNVTPITPSGQTLSLTMDSNKNVQVSFTEIVCNPLSNLPCNQLAVDVTPAAPFCLTWEDGETRGGMLDVDDDPLGFTLVDVPSFTSTTETFLPDPTDPAIPGYVQANLNVDTTAGELIITSTRGINFQNRPTGSTNNDNQQNALGVAISEGSPFTLRTVLVNPAFNVSPGNNAQQAGLLFFINEDNYVKLVVAKGNVSGTTAGVQLAVESNLGGGTSQAVTFDGGTNVSLGTNPQTATIVLEMIIDPIANTVSGRFSINGGTTWTNVRTGVALPTSITGGTTLPSGVGPLQFAGLMTTHRTDSSNGGDGTSIPFRFEEFCIELETYEIIASVNGGNGTISPVGTVPVATGTDQPFTITPDLGYEIAQILVDEDGDGAFELDAPITDPLGDSYTFVGVDSDGAIEVSFAIRQFTLTPNAGPNGAITPDTPQVVDYGTSQLFDITPDAGYVITSITVDLDNDGTFETDITGFDPTGDSYEFSNVTSDGALAATFAELFQIEATVVGGVGGAISPSGTVDVVEGTDQTFTLTPDTANGYEIASIAVDEDNDGTFETDVTGFDPLLPFDYDYTNVTSDGAIQVTFQLQSLEIVASAGTGGSIAPAGTTTVTYGDDQSYTITPDACYEIADVLVDGVSVGAVPAYDFTNVMADATIEASFDLLSYTLTASVNGTGGTIAPSGATPVLCGDDQTFTVTPDTGFGVLEVLVDGSPASLELDGTYTFTNVTANATLEVTFAPLEVTLTASAGTGGSIAPAGTTTVTYGDDQSYTITPDACYEIADVLVDGVSVGAVPAYDFTNVMADATIEASFDLLTYTLTASVNGTGGTIAPNGATPVLCGDDQTFTVTPDTGFGVLEVLVDGSPASLELDGTYTFTNVTANATLEVTFAPLEVTLTASAGTGGSIAPAGTTTVTYGDDQSYTITPDACYEIADVLVDGVSVGAVPAYDFINVMADATIEASFDLLSYTLSPTVTGGVGGSIAPDTDTLVNCGDDQTFTFTPDTGYEVADVLVDGVSVGAVDSYDFTNVIADATIEVTFQLQQFTVTASAEFGGSISPAGDTTVNYGDDLDFTITENAGWAVNEVLVDRNDGNGEQAAAFSGNPFTLSNITSDTTVRVTFTPTILYTLTPTAGLGGSITPDAPQTVEPGRDQTFTLTPDACYEIASITVDEDGNGSFETDVTGFDPAGDSYTFAAVDSDGAINATFALLTYPITASSSGAGTLDPTGLVTVDCGMDQTFVFEPDAFNRIASVLVDTDTTDAVDPVALFIADPTAENSYTFPNVGAPGSIAVVFEAIPTYTLTPDLTITDGNSSAASLTPSDPTVVFEGDDQTFTLTLDPTYRVQSVAVDGNPASLEPDGTYTFTNVMADATLSIVVEPIPTYIIVASAGAGGSISPSGNVTVFENADQTFQVTPNAGFRVLAVLVDLDTDDATDPAPASLEADDTFTFSDVTANGSIEVTFEAIPTYTIVASAGAGGSISPSGNVTVFEGEDQSFTITAGTNFAIEDVLVDGVSIGAQSSYTFNNVDEDHTIEAFFTPTTAGVGNFVFRDLDGDGIQDSGEPGIDGVTLRIYNQGSNTPLAETTTTSGGFYRFNVPLGIYVIEVVPPANFSLSPANQGSDEAADSDFATNNRRVTVPVTTLGVVDLDVADAGLIRETLPLQITKTGFDLNGVPLRPGDTIAWLIIAHNPDTITAEDVVLTDTLNTTYQNLVPGSIRAGVSASRPTNARRSPRAGPGDPAQRHQHQRERGRRARRSICHPVL
ncbi:MAG: hypothetical protein HC915_02620 [Anaerolineae bacterium]|nr:hypothetical protein [Anaerolineae bacterium]